MTPTVAPFPTARFRRLRSMDALRRLSGERQLSVDDLIWPVFVTEGENTRTPIPSMPGVERLSIDLLVEAARRAVDLGIPAICIFPTRIPHLRQICVKRRGIRTTCPTVRLPPSKQRFQILPL